MAASIGAVGVVPASATVRVSYVRDLGAESDVSIDLPVVDAADQHIFLLERPGGFNQPWFGRLLMLDMAGRLQHALSLGAQPKGDVVLGPQHKLYLLTGVTLSVFDARTLTRLATFRAPAEASGPGLAGSRLWLANRSVTFHDFSGVYSTPLATPGVWTLTGADSLTIPYNGQFLYGAAAATPYLGYVDIPLGMLHLSGTTATPEAEPFNSTLYHGQSFNWLTSLPTVNGSGYAAVSIEFDAPALPSAPPPPSFGTALYRPNDLLHPIGVVTQDYARAQPTLSPNASAVAEEIARGPAGLPMIAVQRFSAPAALTSLVTTPPAATMLPVAVTPDGNTLVYAEYHLPNVAGAGLEWYVHIVPVHIAGWSG